MIFPIEEIRARYQCQLGSFQEDQRTGAPSIAPCVDGVYSTGIGALEVASTGNACPGVDESEEHVEGSASCRSYGG